MLCNRCKDAGAGRLEVVVIIIMLLFSVCFLRVGRCLLILLFSLDEVCCNSLLILPLVLSARSIRCSVVVVVVVVVAAVAAELLLLLLLLLLLSSSSNSRVRSQAGLLLALILLAFLFS